MGCDIVFKLHPQSISSSNGEEITAEDLIIENSSLSAGSTLEQIAGELLKNKDVQDKLAKYIKAGQFKNVLTVTENFLNTKGLIGNTTISGLKSKYPKIDWYSSKTPYSPDILLVNSLKLNGKEFTGRVLNNGREIFVVSSSTKSLKSFNNFLKVRDGILTDKEADPKLEYYLEELHKLGGFSDIQTTKELLLDFRVNLPKYENVLIKEGLSSYILAKLRKYANAREVESYDDAFSNELVQRLEDVPYSFKRKISKKKFAKLVNSFYPDILERYGITEAKFAKDNLKIQEVFDIAFKNNPNADFDYKISEITGTDIIFETKFTNMETDFGLTYQTVSDLVNFVEDYRGYGIYEYKINDSTYYYCSLDSITSKSNAKQFISKEAAKEYIDGQYNLNNSLEKTANFGVKIAQTTGSPNTFFDDIFHPKDTVIKSIDIDLKIKSMEEFNSIVDLEEQKFFKGKHLLKEVYDHFIPLLDESIVNRFKSVIDSTEKAAIFICRLNTDIGIQDKRDYHSKEHIEIISNILTEIYKGSLNPKYFYVDSVNRASYVDKRTGKEVKRFKYFVVPVKSRIEYNKVFERPSPSISNMMEIADLLEDKFGVKVEILHPDEIKEKFGTNVSATAKAWISNGIIYINGAAASTNDLMHEYTHLLLGIVKSTNMDMYMKLMDKIGNSKESFVVSRKRKLSSIYGNISDVDLNEEVFASLFGDYLAGRDLHTMFGTMQSVKQTLDKSLQKILPKASEEDFTTLYRGKINDVFLSFSRGIGKMTNGLEFGDYGAYRKASNIIGEWLKDGSLVEKNC